MERAKVLNLVYESMKELNEDQEEDSRLELKEETILFGRDSSLDSLGLVNLIVAIEQRLLDELGLEVELTSEAAMSKTRSPFRTVKSLADYICLLLEEET